MFFDVKSAIAKVEQMERLELGQLECKEWSSIAVRAVTEVSKKVYRDCAPPRSEHLPGDVKRRTVQGSREQFVGLS